MSWNLLRLAEMRKVEICLAPPMLSELAAVLSYRRLRPRLEQLRLTPDELVAYALSLSAVFDIPPSGEHPLVPADPQDDVFVGCAVAAQAAYIVSGDEHLLNVGEYAGIPILSIRSFLAREFPDRVIE